MTEEKTIHKRRVNGIHADVGPKRFLQWIPLLTVTVLWFVGGISAFYNLKGDVRAQSASAKVSKEQRNLSRTRIRQNEQAINELKTQTAVFKNIQKTNEKALTNLNDTMKEALKEMRRSRR